ncbi:MAG: hypothetical protein EBQ51_07215 [Verrucomicrobia bacterium]|nr:hypothetical protein [Verrucomicrobiota bacterium]
MATFTYEALVAGGGRTAGKLEAKSRQEALAQLSKQRMRPLKLHEEGAIAAGGKAGVGMRWSSR